MSDPDCDNRMHGRRLAAVVVAMTAMLAIAGWVFWPVPAESISPDVPLEGVESEVAAAIRAATETVKSDPQSAEGWGKLGHVLRAHDFDVESDVCYTRAEQLDDRDPRWPYLRGDRVNLSDPEAALPLFQRAVQRSQRGPERTASMLRLAETYMKLNRLDAAESLLEDVTTSDPGSARGQWNLGLLRRSQNRLDESATHLLLAAESPFTRRMACAQLAGVYSRLGDQAASRRFAQRVAQSPPDVLWVDPFVTEYLEYEVGAQSRYGRVGRLESQGRLQEAAQILSQEVQRNPGARSFVAYGIVLAKMAQYEHAEEMLTAAVDDDPGKVQAHYFLAVVAYFQGEQLQKRGGAEYQQKFKQAIFSAEQALKLKPDHGLAHLYCGLSLQGLSQTRAAIDQLQAAVQCRPDFPQTHLELGKALVEAERVSEGIVELELAVQLSSGKEAQAAKRTLDQAKRAVGIEEPTSTENLLP